MEEEEEEDGGEGRRRRQGGASVAKEVRNEKRCFVNPFKV